MPATWPWLFEIIFGIVVGLHVILIWSHDFPPVQDYGGHVEFMDIAARHDAPETAYVAAYQLPERLLPNTLSLALAKALSPVFDANQVGKLLLTFYTVGFPFALLALCTVVRRPRWWVFFALPLTPNNMLALGLLNYVIAIPLVIWAIVIAIRWGRDRHRLAPWLLSMVLTLLSFAHLIGFLVGGFFVSLLLLVYARRWRDLFRYAVFLPGFLPVAGFAARMTEVGPFGAQGQAEGLVWTGPQSAFEFFWRWTVDTFTTPLDDFIGAVVLMLAAMLLIQSHHLSSQDEARTTWLETIRRRPLELLLLASVVLYFALPHRYGDVFIRFRIPLLLLAFFLLVPRYFKTRLTHAAVAVAAVMSLTSAASAIIHVTAEARRLEGLPQVVSQIPERSQVLFPRPTRDSQDVWRFRPELHLARGIHALINGGVSAPSFTLGWYSPVRMKDGFSVPKTLSLSSPHARDFDFALVFAEPEAVRNALKAPHLRYRAHQGKWWLLEIVDPKPPRMEVMTPGRLGGPVQGDCPADMVLGGLSVAFDGDGVRSVQTRCLKLTHALTVSGKPKPGKRLGRRPRKLRPAKGKKGDGDVLVECPRGMAMTGLVGTEGLTISKLGIVCQLSRYALADRGDARIPKVKMAARPEQGTEPTVNEPASTFWLKCPQGTVAVGFRGRAGIRIEAVGLACDHPRAWDPDMEADHEE